MRRALIARYLGEAAGAAWVPREPGSLLGLDPAQPVTPQAVAAALRQRMGLLMALGSGTDAYLLRAMLRQSAEAVLSRAGYIDALDEVEQAMSNPAGWTAPIPAPAQPLMPAPTPSPGPPPAPAPSLAPALAPAQPPTPARTAPGRLPVRIVRTGLEHDAARLLAEHGGPTPAAMLALSMVARSRGLEQNAVEQTLANLSALTAAAAGVEQATAPVAAPAPPPAPAVGPGVPGAPAGAPDPVDSDPPPARAGKAWAVVAGVALVLAMAVAAPLLVRLGTGSGKPSADAGIGAGPAVPTNQPTGPVRPPDPRGPSTRPGPAPDPDAPVRSGPLKAELVVADIRAASALLANGGDPRGVSEFRRAVAPFMAGWPTLSTAERQAVVTEVLNFVYRVPDDPTLASAAVDALSVETRLDDGATAVLQPDEVWPAASSAGLLGRLSAERDLPPAVASAVARRAADLLGGRRPRGAVSFGQGLLDALALMPRRLVAAPAAGGGGAVFAGDEPQSGRAAERWALAVLAASGAGPGDGALDEAEAAKARRVADGLICDGLERLLRTGPSATDSRDAGEALSALAGALRWTRGDPAPSRLAAWLEDPAVPSAGLHAVTRRMVAGAAPTEGLTSEMVLPLTGGAEDRGRVRDLLVAAFELPRDTTAQSIADRLVNVAPVLVARAGRPNGRDGIGEQLAVAAALSRLNLAAAHAASGRAALAGAAMRQAEALLDDIQNGQHNGWRGGVPPEFTVSPGEPWAVRFAGELDAAKRAALIRELGSQRVAGNVTRVEGELLAEAAIGEGAAPVRAQARRTIVELADSPAVILGLLKVLPRYARLSETPGLLETVSGRPIGGFDNPRFVHDARRALLERLLEQIADQASSKTIDAEVAELAASYAQAAGESAGPVPPADASAVLLRSSRALVATRRAGAGSVFAPQWAGPGLPEIDRRLSARRVVTGGGDRGSRPQDFAVEQVTIAELLAYTTASARASRAAEVAAVLDELAAARANAGHVFEQLAVTEAAMCKLWIIRLSQGPEAGGGGATPPGPEVKP